INLPPNSARRPLANSIDSASRSSPITRLSGEARRINSLCPPSPSVASMNNPPRAASRLSSVSWVITGRWSSINSTGTREETLQQPNLFSASPEGGNLKYRAAPAPPHLHPYTAALPDASGGNFRRSILPNISNIRRLPPRPPSSLRCATSGRSRSFPARPSAASAHNSWRDPETSAPPESSRADRTTFFQFPPTPVAGKSARNPQVNSSHKNRPDYISHRDSV